MYSYSSSMLERYRRDRRKLLEFILSSANLIREVRAPSGTISNSLSNVNFDSLSVDHVLSCISSGGVLDVSAATKDHYCERALPIVVHSQSVNSYFILTDPDLLGSPPRRMPPPNNDRLNNENLPQSSKQVEQILQGNIAIHHENGDRVKHANGMLQSLEPVEAGDLPPFGLPPLRVGLSDDDLRESAYEMLLASMAFSGIKMLPDQGRKKGRSSKIVSGMKSEEDKAVSQSPPEERDSKLIDTIRVQMQISEAMDLCTKEMLAQSMSTTLSQQTSVAQISLGLVSSISRSYFPYEKSHIQWNNRHANILEELLCSPANPRIDYAAIRYSIGKIRNAMEWDKMSSIERSEILVPLRDCASKVLCLPAQFGIGAGSSSEDTGYHLGIRLYEKLLFAVFDILEEGQLIGEADELLTLLKVTWSTLGITEIIHDALYAWVLLKQFVQTDEQVLLDNGIFQVQKVLAAEPCNGKERHYLDCLVCISECNGRLIQSGLVPAILFSMSIWCDKMLQDYHWHYSQKPSQFRRMLTLALTVGVFFPNEHGKLTKSHTSVEISFGRLKSYVERSLQAAYLRVTDYLDLKSKLERLRPLVLLANGLKLIAEKEFTEFCPVLHEFCPEAGKISATVLYQLFGERLSPFLGGISCLSQDVRLVLAAAHMLDWELTKLHSLACEEDGLHQPLDGVLDHYQIGEVSGPLILDWVIAQHAHISDWISRASDLEDWEPLSSQQKQGVSVVEAFRMIEETVDQFFGLNLPVNITHLQGLLSVIFHSLDTYVTKVTSQLVEKSHLYPCALSLTRYEENVVPIVRKKLVKHAVLDKKVNDILNELTISKLCVRLNTLQYVRNEVCVLEDSIRKSWGLIKPTLKRRWFNIAEPQSPEMLGRIMSACDETVDELFVTTFDGIRNTAATAMIKITDFIGTKVAFWDLREHYIFHLYHGSVEGARIDGVLQYVDSVLSQICGLVGVVLRDPVASSIFRALLEGYVWVLLEGGPCRAFADSDVTLMEDDLRMLKDFFVADGEGLPRCLIEQEAKFAHQVLSLFSQQTGTVIQMLMTASEHISIEPESGKVGHRRLHDANTLIRVLCHKKDREASKFLKRHFDLPMSSEYDDTVTSESSSAQLLYQIC
ncbi:hypothetical protein Ancab_032606 [Ancistrocladus abbreviatus]